jgi:BlaI family transcriptional regulator, penicillinase repressor
MARRPTGRPTDFELEVLKVLWERGPSTVREVLHAMLRERPLGYTTVLKMMQVMREKGLVECDKRVRPQRYKPTQSRTSVLRRLAGDLLERAFNGSTQLFLLHALDKKRCSAQELAAIRELLDEREGKER